MIPAADLLAAIRDSVKAAYETHPHRFVEGYPVMTNDFLETVCRHAAQAALNVLVQQTDTTSAG